MFQAVIIAYDFVLQDLQ